LRSGGASPLPIAEAVERNVKDAMLDVTLAGSVNVTHYDKTAIVSSVAEIKF
jgi:hypothetical protein